MRINDILNEEKTRLDPACWHNKKIGNPKTKMKGGVRVNNCVPKEGVAEGMGRGEYSRVLQALQLYYPRVSMEELNVPGYHKVIANKANVPVEYAAQVINDFVRADEPEDDEQDIAEGSIGKLPQQTTPDNPWAVPGGEDLRLVFQPGKNSGIHYALMTGMIQDPFYFKLNGKVYAISDKDNGVPKEVQPGMAEGFDGEYDDEAGMFKNDLQTIQRVSRHLEKEILDNENLPEWCQAKIAQAKGMIVNVMDYMISQHENGEIKELSEEFDMIERIIECIAAQNGVDAEAVWTDLESLTEDELYAFAVTSQLNEDWQKANKRDKTDGMSRKAVKAYRREHPGSKLQTAVTTKPSKLKKGSKASKRRKSYCSRSRGQMKMHHISCSKTPDKAICKARRRWNC